MTGPAGAAGPRFAGTARLTRLILRRDGVLLPVCVSGIAALLAITARDLKVLYPTAASRQSVAARAGGNPALRFLLGRLNGEPVATSSLLLAGGIVGIYDVSTAPEARGRGIGTAMTAAAVETARAHGYEIAFLQPSAMGKPLYHRVGFRECCICHVYG